MLVYFKEDDASPLKPHSPTPQDSAFNATRDSVNTKLNNVIEADPSSVGSDDFQEFESYQSQQVHKTGVPHSGTSDSIAEGQFKGTPSMTSSGYGSQAVSTLTLSSEDSLSLRSNDDSEVTKTRRSGLEHTSGGESDGDESFQVQNVIATSKGENSSLVSVDSQKTIGVDTETSESTDSLNVDPKKQGFIENSLYTCENAEEWVASNAVVENEIDVVQEENNDTKLEKAVLDSLKIADSSKDIEKISLSTDSDEENVELPESLILHISEEDLREKAGSETKPIFEPVGNSLADKKSVAPKCDTEKLLGIKEKNDNRTDISLPKQSQSLNKAVEERTTDTAYSLSVGGSDMDSKSDRNAAEDNLSDISKLGPHTGHANNASHDKSLDIIGDALHSEADRVKVGDSSSDVSHSLGIDSLAAASDSSSVGSRGVLGSDSVDPYSLEAMDELERLGAECGEDNSEFMSMDEKLENSSINQGNKSLNRSGLDGLDDSMAGYDKDFPKNQSTPKGAKGANRLSVPGHIGLSQKELEGSFRRYSGDFSDTVSGECI